MASGQQLGGANNDLMNSAHTTATSGRRNGSPASTGYGFGSPQSISIDAFMQNQQSGVPYRTASERASNSRLDAQGQMQHEMLPSTVQQHTRPVGDASYPHSARSDSFDVPDLTNPDVTSHGHANRISEPTSSSIGDGAERSVEDNPAPAWSELRTKAGKERKRLPLACIACRRKKIRCSGEKPACKHCLRSRIPCVYKVSTRKAAPRTDYMAMLDKRLKRMEERVIKIIPKEQQSEILETGRAVLKPPLPPATPKPSGSKKRMAEQAFDSELEDWSNARDGKTNGATQKQAEKEAEKRSGMNAADDHSLLLEGADKLPSKELQEHLAEVFFEYVYGQAYHLLHKPSFMRKLSQGTIPPVLTLAVCAISARFSNHPEIRTEPAFLRGEEWAATARDIALRRYDTPNITILIVYLLIGLHEFGTCQGGRSWMFGGMAQRMAYALQLHRDLEHDPKSQSSNGKDEGLTATDREIRRRTMWSCFVMDRFNSSGTDRPVFVAEQYIRAQLPIKEAYYLLEIDGPTEDLEGNVPNPVSSDSGQMSDAKGNMGVAAYLVRLVAIWGRLIHYLNLGGKARDQHPMWSEQSMFQEIQRAAEGWKAELPTSLHYTPENLQNHASEKMANQFLFLHIIYSQTILFMNRFALPTPGTRQVFPKDMPTDFIQDASKAASDAANQISGLVHEAMDYSVVAPFAGYCAFFSSTVHIYGAFSKNAKLEASSKQNLAWNVKYLTKMKKYWGMFHFMAENLRELYRRHADAARQGSSETSQVESQETADAAIFQYGDWYDRYPHGVNGTDFEGSSAEIKKEPGADAVLGQKSDLQTVEEFFSKSTPMKRVVQLQQAHQPTAQQRKVVNAAPTKKRRASRSDGKLGDSKAPSQSGPLSSQSIPNPASSAISPQQSNRNQQHMGHTQPPPHFQDAFNQQGQCSQDPLPIASDSSVFPRDFRSPHNSALATNAPQQLMSQLDRQMVLNSYAGMDSNLNSYNSMLGINQPILDAYHLDAFPSYNQDTNHNSNLNVPPTNPSAINGQVNNGFWGDPSTAWFMPFNMSPPTIGEDNNLFGGSMNSAGGTGNHLDGFDWGNFGGFGDSLPAGGFTSTGLTPGTMEIGDGSTSIDLNSAGQRGAGPDVMDGYHEG
nr:putative transcriptional regulatory protein [Quercus suber]